MCERTSIYTTMQLACSLPLSMCMYIYIYIYVCVCICTYAFMFICVYVYEGGSEEREGGRERERDGQTDRDGHRRTQTDTDRHRQTRTETRTERQTERPTERQADRQTETDRQRDREMYMFMYVGRQVSSQRYGSAGYAFTDFPHASIYGHVWLYISDMKRDCRSFLWFPHMTSSLRQGPCCRSKSKATCRGRISKHAVFRRGPWSPSTSCRVQARVRLRMWNLDLVYYI